MKDFIGFIISIWNSATFWKYTTFVIILWAIYRKGISIKKGMYKKIILLLLILAIFLFALTIFYNSKDLGSLADWISAIGTISAIFSVIWQVNKQKNIESALKIIEKRPRFSVMTTTSPLGETIVFVKNSLKKEDNGYGLKLKSKKRKDAYICIKNISDNVIYNFDLNLGYKCNKEKFKFEHWNFKGIYPGQSVTFLPSFWFKDENNDCIIKRIIIRFYSVANEIGYFEVMNKEKSKKEMYNFDEGKYYFVEDTVKEVEELSKDTMIKKDNKLCKLCSECKNNDIYATLSTTFKNLKDENESL
ncbi:hypothetical protein [Liquorilactobacillus nagelii]|uniref:hypothetical protein n=1 Tax=Liquorilactobacillus nagelii TaxID=82688 RepID=UPI00070D131A|nr:hypothetical protein [Liquorilactobacillus nagelii]QYH53738.1 hypothetical protein G6O73_03080 [Liquorilactobacillus nagelii DSM 13675]